MIPSVGRIVHITLSNACAENITRRRANNSDITGNPIAAGQIYPMIITRVWADNPTETTAVQGQIFLDGSDTYWATSVAQGTEPGQWFEPPRV